MVSNENNRVLIVMSSKLKKEDSQPVINQFFNTLELHTKQSVHKSEIKCITPNESKRKKSPPSNAKPGKKLNLELEVTDDSEHITVGDNTDIEEIMNDNEDNTPITGALGSDPVTADHNSIRRLANCKVFKPYDQEVETTRRQHKRTN